MIDHDTDAEPQVETDQQLKEEAGESWRYARKAFNIPMTGTELHELCELLAHIATDEREYYRIRTAVLLRERLMNRWKKREPYNQEKHAT